MAAVINDNNYKNEHKGCTISDIKFSLTWLIFAGVAVIFILLDRLQSGNVEYQIYSTTQKEIFYCGYNTITYKCDEFNRPYTFCSRMTQETYIRANDDYSLILYRKDINSSYSTVYGYAYYVFMILALSIPWMVVSFIFICNPLKFWKASLDAKYCILFLLATIMSTIAFIFGMIMITNYDCSNQLYNFIDQLIVEDTEININSVYPAFNEDDFTTWPSSTFIFLWINLVICIITTFHFIQKQSKDEEKQLLLQSGKCRDSKSQTSSKHNDEIFGEVQV